MKYDDVLRKLGSESKQETLSVEDVEYIHQEMCRKYGGETLIRDENLLESVCTGPYQEVFGETLYPSVIDKAAKYLFDFCTYQVFVDGNKRTGLGTCLALLKKNGYELTYPPVLTYELCMGIANGRYQSSLEISNILKNHVVFRKAPEQNIHEEEAKEFEPEPEREDDNER